MRAARAGGPGREVDRGSPEARWGGGRPIVEDGQVIGAIGVGGGTPEADDEVAQAALAAL